ncbi:MAG: Gfo/Idh/MocA family oxidoreductase [Hyphomonadaceae bacterium]
MTLAVGLVGVGPWGAHVLRDLRALGATVHGAVRSPESLERATTGGCASIVADPASLPECDGYVIANRTQSHLDAIDVLLPRGRPIFCEKPISSDVERTKRLPRAAHELVFIMHKWRYHPGIIEFARIASSEEYGPVQGLRTLRLGWKNPHEGTNSLWVLAPHELSIALEIFGEVPELINAAPDPMDADMGGIGYFRTSGGVPFVTEFSFGHPMRQRRLLMRCRDAALTIDDSDYAAIIVQREGANNSETVRISEDMPLLAELRRFLAHLRGGPAPVSSFADELKIITVLAQMEAAIART